MANRFLSRNSVKSSEDDDLLKMQRSALNDTNDSEGDEGGIGADILQQAAQITKISEPKAKTGDQSILQKGIVITGSVISKTDLVIYGSIKGNVTCESDVTIDGTVDGNVKAKNVKFLGGHIKGDAQCDETITLRSGSVINGNISAASIRCDGKVEGNTIVIEKAVIEQNAVIIGDLVCEKVSISEGAVLKGKIETREKVQTAKKPAAPAQASDEGKGKPSESEETVTLPNFELTDLKKYI